MKLNRIEEEKVVVEQMVRLYCRKREGSAELGPSCKELLVYVHSPLTAGPLCEHEATC